jgi:hypothetical protein
VEQERCGEEGGGGESGGQAEGTEGAEEDAGSHYESNGVVYGNWVECFGACKLELGIDLVLVRILLAWFWRGPQG